MREYQHHLDVGGGGGGGGSSGAPGVNAFEPFRYDTKRHTYSYYDTELANNTASVAHPLPHWMEQDLGLDEYNKQSVDDSAATRQVAHMAQTIGQQCSEIEKLKFELSRTKMQLNEMEKQSRQYMAKLDNANSESSSSDLYHSSSSGSEPTSASSYLTRSPLAKLKPFERNIWSPLNTKPVVDTVTQFDNPWFNTDPVQQLQQHQQHQQHQPKHTLTTLANLSTHEEEEEEEKDKMDMVYPIKLYNEPLNYRKLLERTVSCNWKFIVDRIVLDNDQQASIFLQQKLKIANHDQKLGIISAIIEQSYMLMINRFGNFLVQRCLEYGNSKQVAAVTRGMIGNVVDLAMDPFGCHVIQKALDCVENDMKTLIVQEMLTRVTESVVHRYACHVWQKLFELRWNEAASNSNATASTPPRFMQQVNKELFGMWTQVALGETGSLVVQNIFENCLDGDKRPCVEEVVENLDTIIRGQWGNWVIQHMVEHADEPYREIVCQQIIEHSPVYSTDQFASKVVEKMLKMGEIPIIQGFLDKVTEKIPDRPRIPLIDIASDAHGNYLIQYILQSGTQQQKDQVAVQIKKHMVSLRGSKWGSKCAWLIDKNNRSKKK